MRTRPRQTLVEKARPRKWSRSSLSSLVCTTFAVGLLVVSSQVTQPCVAQTETTPFANAPADQGLTQVRGTVGEIGSDRRVYLDVGDAHGIRTGQLLQVLRAEKNVGTLQVMDVLENSCHCLADQEVLAGDQFRLVQTTRIEGRCAGSNGEPVAGVSVGLFRRSFNYADPSTLIATTVTNDDGEFSLDDVQMIALASYGSDLTIVAKKPRLVSRFSNLVSPGENIVFNMDPNPGTVAGIVLDASGTPVANARVSIPNAAIGVAAIYTAQTDEKGKFIITDLARWEPIEGVFRTLRIVYPNGGVANANFSKVPSVVKIKLPMPSVIKGRVFDAVNGKPVPNALVSAQGVGERGWYETRADQEGLFTLNVTPDRYNIWSHMVDRIPIAVDSLRALPGESRDDVEIRMVRGGIVYGHYQQGDGEPVRGVDSLRVGNYGPARPRSGAGVISTKIATDGSFRLRVAPGRNYIYVMGADSSANFEIEDEEELEVNLQVGKAAPREVANRDRRARVLPLQKMEVAANKAFQFSRERGNGPAALLLDQLEQQNQSREMRFTDDWLRTMKDIVDIGPNAVPELIRELDHTSDGMMLRCMGFCLRAIDDRRAIPALIRAIPKTLVRPGSDMGLNAEDEELYAFARKFDLDEQNRSEYYSFGRPVREIVIALQKLTGHKMDDQKLFNIFLQGTEQQQVMKLKLFERQTLKWADWWKTNSENFELGQEYAEADLPAYEQVVTVPGLIPGGLYKVTSMRSNWILESALEPKSERVFYDFDTGQLVALPERWRDLLPAELPMQEIEEWAEEEGFDLMGTRIATGDDKQPQVYALKMLGMQAWQIKDERWKTRPASITLEELQEEGSQVEDYLLRQDGNEVRHFDPASFFALTREGTPVLLFLGIEVLDNSLQPGGVFEGDDELRPVAFHKGRRFAFGVFEATE